MLATPFLDETPPFTPFFAFFSTISTFSSITALLFQGEPIVRPIFLFYNKFISRILRFGALFSRACIYLISLLYSGKIMRKSKDASYHQGTEKYTESQFMLTRCAEKLI